MNLKLTIMVYLLIAFGVFFFAVGLAFITESGKSHTIS